MPFACRAMRQAFLPRPKTLSQGAAAHRLYGINLSFIVRSHGPTAMEDLRTTVGRYTVITCYETGSSGRGWTTRVMLDGIAIKGDGELYDDFAALAAHQRAVVAMRQRVIGEVIWI